MERLTYWNEEYGCWSYRGPSGEAAKRLAAYEDTDLTPEVLKEFAPFLDEMRKSLGAMRRLKELTEADRAGRLVVLPCKVGDTLYVISSGEIIEVTVRTFFLGHPSRGVEDRESRMIRTTRWDLPMAKIGLTVFLTRQEAEEALREEEQSDA